MIDIKTITTPTKHPRRNKRGTEQIHYWLAASVIGNTMQVQCLYPSSQVKWDKLGKKARKCSPMDPWVVDKTGRLLSNSICVEKLHPGRVMTCTGNHLINACHMRTQELYERKEVPLCSNATMITTNHFVLTVIWSKKQFVHITNKPTTVKQLTTQTKTLTTVKKISPTYETFTRYATAREPLETSLYLMMKNNKSTKIVCHHIRYERVPKGNTINKCDNYTQVITDLRRSIKKNNILAGTIKYQINHLLQHICYDGQHYYICSLIINPPIIYYCRYTLITTSKATSDIPWSFCDEQINYDKLIGFNNTMYLVRDMENTTIVIKPKTRKYFIARQLRNEIRPLCYYDSYAPVIELDWSPCSHNWTKILKKAVETWKTKILANQKLFTLLCKNIISNEYFLCNNGQDVKCQYRQLDYNQKMNISKHIIYPCMNIRKINHWETIMYMEQKNGLLLIDDKGKIPVRGWRQPRNKTRITSTVTTITTKSIKTIKKTTTYITSTKGMTTSGATTMTPSIFKPITTIIKILTKMATIAPQIIPKIQRANYIQPTIILSQQQREQCDMTMAELYQQWERQGLCQLSINFKMNNTLVTQEDIIRICPLTCETCKPPQMSAFSQKPEAKCNQLKKEDCYKANIEPLCIKLKHCGQATQYCKVTQGTCATKTLLGILKDCRIKNSIFFFFFFF